MPLDPSKMARGPQKTPKTAIFCHIWPHLLIGSPSYLKLVGRSLNKVENCIPHLGSGLNLFGHIKNCPVGEGKAPKRAIFNHIWSATVPQAMAIFGVIKGPSGPKWFQLTLDCNTKLQC